nr:hypothetical protein [Thiorhodovibrio litoralis]
MVHWLYRHDRDLHPYDNGLGVLLHATSFQNLVPQAVYLKARLIQQRAKRPSIAHTRARCASRRPCKTAQQCARN